MAQYPQHQLYTFKITCRKDVRKGKSSLQDTVKPNFVR